MFKILSRIKLLWAIYRYLQDPNQVDSVLKLGNQLLSKDNEKSNQERYLQNPKMAAMIRNRVGIEKIDLEGLKEFSQGSLGLAYYEFIKGNRLDASFYQMHTKINLETDYEYIVFRIRQTHDLWHVVTGFRTTQEGEAGLIAFYYAQLQSPLSALIIGLAFIHFLLKRPKDLPLLFDEVTKGWQMGKNAKSLLIYPWESNWSKSLQDIRKELGVL